MSKHRKPLAAIERLEGMIRASWIASIQMELVRRDENALLVTIQNYKKFVGLTPQQAADKAILHKPKQKPLKNTPARKHSKSDRLINSY